MHQIQNTTTLRNGRIVTHRFVSIWLLFCVSAFYTQLEPDMGNDWTNFKFSINTKYLSFPGRWLSDKLISWTNALTTAALTNCGHAPMTTTPEFSHIAARQGWQQESRACWKLRPVTARRQRRRCEIFIL